MAPKTRNKNMADKTLDHVILTILALSNESDCYHCLIDNHITHAYHIVNIEETFLDTIEYERKDSSGKTLEKHAKIPLFHRSLLLYLSLYLKHIQAQKYDTFDDSVILTLTKHDFDNFRVASLPLSVIFANTSTNGNSKNYNPPLSSNDHVQSEDELLSPTALTDDAPQPCYDIQPDDVLTVLNNQSSVDPTDLRSAFTTITGISKKGETFPCPSRPTVLSTDGIIELNGCKYRPINMAHISYHMHNNVVIKAGHALAARGVNCVVLGSDLLSNKYKLKLKAMFKRNQKNIPHLYRETMILSLLLQPT